MSMNAMFVSVEDADIAHFEADPDAAEALFSGEEFPTRELFEMTAAMQERLLANGPQMMAATLSRLPEPLRQQIEASLGRTTEALAAGQSGAEILQLMQGRLSRRQNSQGGTREILSLDKAWHGVRYLLTGTAEPGSALRSQAILGGRAVGDDPEGFAGYGPARYFTSAQVRELSEELSRPETESEAAARFDVDAMSRLQIYPGWRAGEQDKEWLMDAFRRLRDFYSSAAERGQAVISCLV